VFDSTMRMSRMHLRARVYDRIVKSKIVVRDVWPTPDGKFLVVRPEDPVDLFTIAEVLNRMPELTDVRVRPEGFVTARVKIEN